MSKISYGISHEILDITILYETIFIHRIKCTISWNSKWNIISRWNFIEKSIWKDFGKFHVNKPSVHCNAPIVHGVLSHRHRTGLDDFTWFRHDMEMLSVLLGGGGGGGGGNAHKLLNLRALNFYLCMKYTSFNVWVRYFVWNFKWYLWNSTQYILPIHWKIRFLYCVEILRALGYKSSKIVWQ